MLARLLQISTIGLLSVGLACATLLATRVEALWAIAAFALASFGYSIILGLEFMLLAAVNQSDPAPPAAARELVRAWWGEALIAAQVFYWDQPFRSQAQPDHIPLQAGGKVGIVFVHGFLCNRGLWNPWLRQLRELEIPFVAINLEPVFGSIDHYPPIIDQAVQRIEAATATRPLIVAHSMGGLAVRAWLAAFQADARISRIVTIGTPHRGTVLGRLAFFMPNARQMRLDSAWQRALAQLEPSARHARP